MCPGQADDELFPLRIAHVLTGAHFYAQKG